MNTVLITFSSTGFGLFLLAIKVFARKKEAIINSTPITESIILRIYLILKV